jgi:hypothetical protein
MVAKKRSSSCFSSTSTRGLPLAQFGIGLAHLGHQVGHQLVEEGLARAQLVAVADGAADDAAQHVAAPFVAGDHAVGDQEGAGADVVGQHLQRGLSRSAPEVSRAAALIRFWNRSIS